MGLEHRLRHRPRHLSGGERQRVAIARALMNQPRVVFADEPTGNLDADTGRQIMAVLERLHEKKQQTIVLVTHDRSLAQRPIACWFWMPADWRMPNAERQMPNKDLTRVAWFNFILSHF